MRKNPKLERTLFAVGAGLLVVVLVLLVLLLRQDRRSSAHDDPGTLITEPEETAAPNTVTIAGKAVVKDTDTFYLNNARLTDEDKELIVTLQNVNTLSLTNCGLYDIYFLSRMPKLTTVYLSHNSITDLTPLKGLLSLRTLYLDGNPVTDLSALNGLPLLTTLSLKEVRLPDSVLQDFRAAMPGCYVFDDNAVDGARPLSLGGLEFTEEDTALDLSGRGITDITKLVYCKKLEDLNLAGNPLESIATLKELPALRALNLSATGLTDSDLTIIMGIRNLTWLDIRGNAALTADGLDVLVGGLPNCQILHDDLYYRVRLGETEIFSDADTLSLAGMGIADLSGLEKFERVTSADLSNNAISNISPLKNNVHMLTLNLENNRISRIDTLYHFPELTILDLSGNQIMDSTPLAGCASLRSLDLSDNQLTEIAHLALCSQLEWLDLRGNPLVSWEMVEYLRLILPACTILTDAVPPTPEPVYEEPVYEEPAPVYQEPAPVYQEPAPVYEEPAPVYEEPAPVYEEPAPAAPPAEAPAAGGDDACLTDGLTY